MPEPPAAASTRQINSLEIQTIPTQIDSGDILRTVPGLLISQHSGGGKANEYMLRGFYADHGTDIAFSADGIPLNFVSHGHGQGYTDLHMLIPETISRIDVDKGPYRPEQGNFATAGSIRMKFFDALPENFASLTAGSFGTERVVAGVNLPHVLDRSYLAIEQDRTDGPFDHNEDYSRLNALWKGSQDLSSHSKLTLLGTSFKSSWYASGLIPARAVDEGLISPFGAIDPTQGGKTERHNLSGTYTNDLDNHQNVEVQAYYTRYILQLFSNFTLFVNDPVHGDGIEQDDNRQMVGGHAQYSYAQELQGGRWITAIGIDSRNDRAGVDLWNEEARVRLSSVSLSNVWEQSVGVYAKEDIPLTQKLRFDGGLRYDDARFEADGASGTDAVLSPKASLIFASTPILDLFVNYGEGFHSNDARTVATAPSSGLVKAKGVEVGARGQALDKRMTSSLVFWAMDLDSELTLDPDTGGTEPSGPSRRAGVESEWGYQILPWLHSDLDINFAQSKYRDSGGAVPYAIDQYVSGGLTAFSATGWQGAIRFRDVGNRWGNDARTVPLQAYCVFDVLAGYRLGHWGIQVAVDNLANTSWRDGQEVITSRLPGEAVPVQDVQFTAGNPRTVLTSVKYYF